MMSSLVSIHDFVHNTVTEILSQPKTILNRVAEGKEPWKVIVGSCVATAVAIKVYHLYMHEDPFNDLKKAVFRLVRKIPAVRRRVEKELIEVKQNLDKEMVSCFKGKKFMQKLPEEGWATSDIISEIEEHVSWGKSTWASGKVSGAVYHHKPDIYDLQMKAYTMAVTSNLLHADIFPGARKMEAEVVRIIASMFHGGPSACGAVTGGGTESLILATLAYRNYGKEVKGIKYPEMVMPVTAHAGFDKAAEFFGIKIRHIKLDADTFKVDVKAMERAVNRNTIMLVASTPGFPHGIIDPVEEIAKIGVKYNVPVHVDACLGGFLLPFMEDAGFPLKPFDFRVKGVTSISCDSHKYGFVIKGSSVVMYAEEKYRHYQFFVQPDWPGGIYASPTIAGSRPGGIVVATWAALMKIGYNGYVNSARKIISTAKFIEKELRKIPGLKILGKPEVSVIAFTSSEFNIYQLQDALNEKGWHLNNLQFPPSIHIAVTDIHASGQVAESLVNDIKNAAAQIRNSPKGSVDGKATLYGTTQTIPDRSIVTEIAWRYLDSVYDTNINIPSNDGL